MLIGYRGTFLFAPVLLFGLWEAVRDSIYETGWMQKLSWLALLIFIGTITSYAIQISDFGGGSYGLRWVIAVLPLFILLTGYWFHRNSALVGRLVFGLLLIISMLISIIGLYNSWPQNAVNPSPILENIVYMSFGPAAGNTHLANWIVETFSLDKGLSYYELAREAWRQEQIDSAVDYFKISIQKNPTQTLSYYQLGMLLDISYRSSEAIPVFQKLIELEPDNLGVRNNYGLALIHNGNYYEAEKVYRFVLSKDSTNFYTMLGLANCLRLETKYQDSLNLAKQTLQLYPESIEAKNLYNQIEESLSKKD